jgi:hypothetical protein
MRPLEELKETFPLGDRWSEPQVFEEVVSIGGVEITLAGLAAESTDGETVTGSAADIAEIPLPRAYFELLERASVVGLGRERRGGWPVRDLDGASHGAVASTVLAPQSPDPTRWKYARSNGVALSSSWGDACRRSLWELIERDRILRSWYGAIKPTRLAMEPGTIPHALRELYAFDAYSFDDPQDSQIHVVGVFGFPRADSAPLLYGFGARPARAEALSVASRECVQRLGFLWGEAIPASTPEFEPTPDFHQELFLCPSNHAVLRAWLDGEHGVATPKLRPPADASMPRLFADITPPELATKLFVAKAIPQEEWPLVFGSGHPWIEDELPEDLRVHPIA